MADTAEKVDAAGGVLQDNGSNGAAAVAGGADPAGSDPSVSMADVQAAAAEGEEEVSSSVAGVGADSAAGGGNGAGLPPPPEHPGPKISGMCKWFDPAKGYGFITPAGGGEDVFVHQSSLYASGYRSLAEGEEVLFAIDTGEDGRNKAVAVTGPDGGVVQGAPRRRYGGGGGGGHQRSDFRGGGIAGGGRGNYGGGGYSRGGGRARMGPPRGMGPGPMVGPDGEAEESSGYQVVVHNLPWRTTWQDLKDHFSSAGTVLRADIAQDPQSRRSKGYGTILYERQEDADTAIRELNSTEYEGRTISVRLDRYA